MFIGTVVPPFTGLTNGVDVDVYWNSSPPFTGLTNGVDVDVYWNSGPPLHWIDKRSRHGCLLEDLESCGIKIFWH